MPPSSKLGRFKSNISNKKAITSHTEGLAPMLNVIKRIGMAKSAIFIAGILVGLPLFKVFYWFVESRYLAELGIPPSFYTPKIFESNTLITWSAALITKPLFHGAFLLFGIVFTLSFSYSCYSTYRRRNSNSKKRKKIVTGLTLEIVENLDRSYTPPAIIFVIGVTIPSVLLIAFLHYSKPIGEQGALQLKLFSEKGECKDLFSKNQGCYKIENDEKRYHLLIANTDSHIVYLTRQCQEPNAPCANLTATVKDKSNNSRVTRDIHIAQLKLEGHTL